MDFFFTIGLVLLAFPVIAIVALVKTINISDRLRGMEARLAALEPKTAGAHGAAPAPVVTPQPVPAAPAPEPAPAPTAPTSAIESPPLPEAVATPPPQPAAAAEPARVVSFEEKFGTRWTVWIGGVALALVGIFLVKYSIEAGLIGPGLRLFFGALLATALV